MIRVKVYTTAPESHGVSWPAFPETFDLPDTGGEIKHLGVTIEVSQAKISREQLARDIISLADDAGMPDSFKESDARMARAQMVLLDK